MKNFRIVIAFSLALTACPQAVEPVPTPRPPLVTSFTVNPTTVANPGELVTLAWATQDARRVTLEQVGKGPITIDSTQASGSTQVAVVADGTFVLTAAGEGGTDSAVKSVKVTGSTGGLLFTANPDTVEPGESVTLVWNAPGASSVTITPAGGAALDLGGQTAAGSVTVTPRQTTRYTLTAGSATATADVTVQPVILSFTASPSPAAGQPVTLSWKTAGASSVTLRRVGAAAPLRTEMDPLLVADGSFQDTAPNLPTNAVIDYRLEVQQGTTRVEAALTVRIGGSLLLNSFTVPTYVRVGLPIGVSWGTSGASSVEIFLDGRTVYVAPNAAAAAGGSTVLPGLDGGSAQVRIVLRDSLGGQVTADRTVTTVGVPTFVSFTADTNAITAGGDPVVLSWNVTNARSVRITQTGVGAVHTATGVVDTGSVTVYPNRNTTQYTLTADNGAGDAIAPQTVMVTVASVAQLTFAAALPQGANGSVTGHTVVGGTQIFGLPGVEENKPGEAFVDILSTGTSISYSGPDTSAKLVSLPETFSTVLYGRRVTGDSLSVSINGWFMFNTTTASGPDNNVALPSTTFEPLAIAPYWDDLYDIGPSEIYYRLDDVAGDRRLIVQWNDVEHDDFTGSRLTFQAQLFSSGKVVFAYGRIDGVPTVNPSVGVTSSTELDAVVAPSEPAVGKTFTFFTLAATLPQTLRIEPFAYVARVAVGTGFIEVQGSGLLRPGNFGITELNPRPAAGVMNGEWMEVRNFTNAPVDLNGMTLNFGAASTHLITGSVIVPPNGSVVLAQAMDLGDATAGIAASYVYPPTFAMSDTSGTVTLDIAGIAYSTASWNATSLTGAGISVRIDRQNPALVYSALPTCSGATTGTYGVQTGTPGTAHPACAPFPYTLSQLPMGNFESIAATGTVIDPGSDSTISTVVLPNPIRYFGMTYGSITLSSNGVISTNVFTAATTTNRTTPSTSAPTGTIAPFWENLTATPGMGVGCYRAERDPDSMAMTGDEYTIISWEGYRVGTGQSLNFQVKFFANGNIEYHFGQMTQGTSTTATTHQGSSATTWLEDPTGRVVLPVNINSLTPGIQPDTAFRYTYTP